MAEIRSEEVRINVRLSGRQALALAQFLRRSGYDDYEAQATSSNEAQYMLEGAEAVRQALRQVGFDPRG